MRENVKTYFVILLAVMVLFANMLVKPNIAHARQHVNFAQKATPPQTWIEIKDAAGLRNINNNLSANYKLMADIDLRGENWVALGSPSSPFTGKFDGNSKVIRNLTINKTDGENQGVFSVIGPAGEVSNLGIEDAGMTVGSYAGMAAGVNYGTISRCYAKGSVSGENYVGGLVGQNTGSSRLLDCFSSGFVSGKEYFGGLLGSNGSSATVERCYSTSKAMPSVFNNYLQFNGISGYISIPHIPQYETNAFTLEAWFQWDEPVTNDVDFIVGKGYEMFEIHTGGGAGTNGIRFIPIPNVGADSWLDVRNCIQPGWFHVAAVYDFTKGQASIYINGRAQDIWQKGVNVGKVASLPRAVNPLAGNTNNFNIGRRTDNSYYFKGKISDVRFWNTARTSEQIAADKDKQLSGTEPGLIGYWKLTESSGPALDSSGNHNNGTVNGGAVRVQIAEATYQGGLIGQNAGTVLASYYDKEVAERSDIGKGEPKTTLQMKQSDTYVGWNVTNVWGFAADQNNGYPQLRSTSKDILSFAFEALEPDVLGMVSQSAQTIAITVPFGTDLTSLTPSIVHTGSSISPELNEDFSTPRTYTVTAQDGSTRDYIVSVAQTVPIYSLMYSAGPHGSVTGSTAQSVSRGESGTRVTAVADVGYRFVKWSDNVMTATRTDLNVTADLDVTATFDIDNDPPVVSGVGISGVAQVGMTLLGSYSYNDANGDLEGISTFQWYRALDVVGSGKTAIPGASATAYVLQPEDLGKYISFEVTPLAQTGNLIGMPVESGRTAAVIAAQAAPTVSNVRIDGAAQVAQTLLGSYSYSDANGDPEGSSTYQWYRASDNTGGGKSAILGANAATYVLQPEDLGKYISFEVTPLAQTGIRSGVPVQSSRVFVHAHVVTVNFDAHDGTVTPFIQNKQYGSAYGKAQNGTTDEALPLPAKQGYIFDGWWTGCNGTGTRISNDTPVNMVSDHTLYAKWTIASYTVAYNAGAHGTFKGASSETVVYNGRPVCVPDIMVDDGYLFSGWSSDGGNTKLTKDQVKAVAVVANVRYTATYSRATCSIYPIDDQMFATLLEGYLPGTQESKSVEITRKGNRDIENLSVTMSGTQAERFILSQPLDNTLNEDTLSTTFMVKAKDGLPIGTYTATVTVTADDMADEAFEITQTVNPKATAKRTIAFIATDGNSGLSDVTISIGGQQQNTDSNGAAQFELFEGTYALTLHKPGYEDVTKDLLVDSKTPAICVVMGKSGELVLSDGNGVGGMLIAENNALPPTVTLIVKQTQTDTKKEEAVEKFNRDYHITTSFDIYLLFKNTRIQPKGTVRIGIPIPSGLEDRSLIVVRINDDGTVTPFDTTSIGNMLFFTTDHFSTYAILSAKDQVTPSTASAAKSDSWLWLSLMFVLLGLLVMRIWHISKTRRYKSHENRRTRI